MKVAVIHAFNKPLAIEDVPRPKADSGEVVVKIETCGLCHSDIHAAHGDWPIKPNLPLIPGHEAVGVAGGSLWRIGELTPQQPVRRRCYGKKDMKGH